jgi:CheY-like chemotaxis protein
MKLKIFLAEDDPGIRTLTKFILEKEGFELIVAEDGQKAWDALQSVVPDVIMCDVQMPQMDGFTLMKKINGDPRFNNAIKVFLTSMRERENIQQGLSLNVHDYITKPFSPGELRQRLQSLIDARKK